MDKTTAVIDSPEALGAALCRHVPDMANGFTIQTRHGDIYITAADAAPFVSAMEFLLLHKIARLQGEQREIAYDIQRYQAASTASRNERYRLREAILAKVDPMIDLRHRMHESAPEYASKTDQPESRDDLVRQITELKKIADEEVAAAMNKAPGMTWFIQCLMMYDDGIMPAESVIRAARECLKLPTPVSPAFNRLGKLNCRLYRGPHRAKASDQEAGD